MCVSFETERESVCERVIEMCVCLSVCVCVCV